MSTAVIANNLPIPSALGSVDAYINAVHQIPVLTLDEEQALARRYNGEDDLDAAKRLVMSHLRFVVHVARGYNGYGLQLSDLIQEGNIGLMKAVKRFDPERGVRLVSFAIHWIKAEMHEYILRNWRLVKVATTKAQRKLFFNLRSMKKGLAPLTGDDVQRVARELRVKPEEVREMETRLAGQEMAFDAEESDDEVYAPVHYLADNDAEPYQVLEQKESEEVAASGLARALSSLDQRSRRIVEARWLREKDAATLHDLAAEFKVSAERIRQIEAKALEKMRKSMGAAASRALPAPAAN